MNLPNKLTMLRIVLTIFIISILLFPFDSIGVPSAKLFINEEIVIDIKYIIAGGIFILAALTDFIDGAIARKYNMVTDLGKILDAVSDKFLIDSTLVILTSQGLIHPIIPIIIITRDIVIDTIEMIVGDKEGIKNSKINKIFLIIGIILTLFNNLPFELINIKVSDILLIIASVLALSSSIQYYQKYKDKIFS